MKKLVKTSVRFLCFVASTSILSALPAHADFWELSGERMIHDPSLVQEGKSWYAFGTGEINRRGIRVLKSDNGRHWVAAPSVLSQPLPWWRSYLPKHELNQWAPDVKYFNGRYWMFYSVSAFGDNNSFIGLLSTTSLNTNNWRDDGLVIRSTSANNFNAIDGDLVIDASGDPWMSFGSFWSGIKLTRLDKRTMKPTGPVHSLAARPIRNNPIEAPNIIYKDGYYYLFVSFDKCCDGVASTYKVAYGRSRSITGPFFDKNGTNMLHGGGTLLDTGNDRWRGPGHQDVLNNNLLVRHAYDGMNGGMPTMLINDLYWDAAGWPTYDRRAAAGIVSGANYRIRNVASGKLAEVYGWGMADGTDIVQWRDNGGANQIWKLIDSGDGYYKVINVFTGKVLEVYQKSRLDAADVRQWSDNGGVHQQWRLLNLDGGRYAVINRLSGKALDGYGTVDGSDIIQFSNHGGANQQWYFEANP